MKTKLFLLTALIALTTFTNTVCAQNNKIVSKNYTVSSFNAIESDIVGNIIFTQSANTSVSAEGDEDMVNRLIVKVEKGILKLSSKKDIRKSWFGNRKSKRMTVRISSPEITSLKNEGVGSVKLDGTIKTGDFKLESDGVGSFEANRLECNRIRIESEGVGSINLKGSAQFAEFISDGVGSIQAQDFKAEDIVVRLSGVGSIKCYASKTAELYGSGVGSITYYGNPRITKMDKSGVGGIKSGN